MNSSLVDQERLLGIPACRQCRIRHDILSYCPNLPRDDEFGYGDLLDDLVVYGGFVTGSGFDSCRISDALSDLVDRFGRDACDLVEEALNRLVAAEPVAPAFVQACRRSITREWVALYARFLRGEEFSHDFLPELEHDDDDDMDTTTDDYMEEQDGVDALGACFGSLMVTSAV